MVISIHFLVGRGKQHSRGEISKFGWQNVKKNLKNHNIYQRTKLITMPQYSYCPMYCDLNMGIISCCGVSPEIIWNLYTMWCVEKSVAMSRRCFIFNCRGVLVHLNSVRVRAMTLAGPAHTVWLNNKSRLGFPIHASKCKAKM